MSDEFHSRDPLTAALATGQFGLRPCPKCGGELTQRTEAEKRPLGWVTKVLPFQEHVPDALGMVTVGILYIVCTSPTCDFRQDTTQPVER